MLSYKSAFLARRLNWYMLVLVLRRSLVFPARLVSCVLFRLCARERINSCDWLVIVLSSILNIWFRVNTLRCCRWLLNVILCLRQALG